LTAKGAKGLWLAAVNDAARKQGLKTGMAFTDARALFPALLSAPADAEEDSRMLRRLALWCTRFTPSSAEDGVDGLRLDITGAAHLWGGEADLARDIKTRIAALGFTARLGMADTFGAAWALAHFGRKDAAEGGPCHLTDRIPGQSRAALAGLPVEALRLAPETSELLKRLGFYRISDLYDLPRVSLKRRFPAKDAAEAALLRLDQALGERPEPALNVEESPVYSVRRDFAEPLIATEGVEQAVEDLAQQLAAQLAGAEKGARRIVFRAYLVCGGCVEARAGLSAPSRDPNHFLRLLRDKINQLDVGFGADGLTLAADAIERSPSSQLGLAVLERNASLGEQPEDGLAALIDRLSNRLGPERVSRLVPQASWTPERADVPRPAAMQTSPASDEARSQAMGSAPLRPFLIFERPEPVAVVALLPEGPPRQFRWRRIAHRVTRAEGPERIAPEWWREIGQAGSKPRDYYRVEDENGRRYWLFREGLYHQERSDGDGLPRWWLQGVYG
jgi:protein ImuB